MNTLSSVLSWFLLISGPGQAPADGDGFVCSPQSTFRIPIELSASERQGISAIRLFVSEDQGETWVRHSDGDPAMDVVTFRASKDGPYWFAIALVDKAGVQTPGDVRGIEPGLKVLVDTQKPEMQLKAIRNRAGRRGIRWTFDDSNIDTNTYRLAVRDESTGRWREYDIRHPEEKMVWFDPNEAFSKLQACVKDRAGNERVIELEVIGEQFSRKDINQFAIQSRAASMQPSVVPVSAEEPAAGPAAPSPVKNAVAQQPVMSREADPRSSGFDRPSDPSPAEPVARPRMPMMSEPKTPFASSNGPEPTLCSSNHIVVNYVVEASASGGRPMAELWAQQPGVQGWQLIGVDEDGRTPIEAKLPSEGAWGLKIVVREGVDPTPGPAAGSPPEMVVEVDATPPQVRVAPASLNDGRVLIRWEASDANLDAQPIDLLYSASPRGPWRPLATGLKNVGEYVWDIAGTGVPAEVCLRVEARDRARHVGFGLAPEPIRLLAGPR
jgi:hypothetical protein